LGITTFLCFGENLFCFLFFLFFSKQHKIDQIELM